MQGGHDLMIQLVAALSLTIVLGYSSFAKLRDRGRFSIAVTNLGVPTRFVSLVTTGIPVIEMALAIGLVIPGLRQPCGIAAAGLVFIFTAVIAINLVSHEERPSCNCFGASSARPIGKQTLVRNAVIISVAVLAALPPTEMDLNDHAWLLIIVAAAGLELLAVLIMGWLVANLTREHAGLTSRLSQLEVLANPSVPSPNGVKDAPFAVETGPLLRKGAVFPQIYVDSEGEGRREITQLLHKDKATLILLVSEGCVPCRSLMDNRLSQWVDDSENHKAFILPVLRGEPSKEAPVRTWLSHSDASILELLGVPAGILVDPKGMVLSSPKYGEQEIATLVDDRSRI
jgi:hypothetical protein